MSEPCEPLRVDTCDIQQLRQGMHKQWSSRRLLLARAVDEVERNASLECSDSAQPFSGNIHLVHNRTPGEQTGPAFFTLSVKKGPQRKKRLVIIMAGSFPSPVTSFLWINLLVPVVSPVSLMVAPHI